MSEMARTVNLAAHARLAQSVFVHDAHEVIIDAVRHWITILTVGLLFIDLSDGEASDIFFRQD